MAGQRTKLAAGADRTGALKANGPKKLIPSPPASGATTPDVEERAFTLQVVRPDKAAFDAEQQTLRDEIAKLQARMGTIQSQLNSSPPKDDQSDTRREELKTQQQEIRAQWDGTKQSREPIIAQLRALNESIAKKSKELVASKSKIKAPYKTMDDVDVQLRQLEEKVESGTMKVADEKRALGEISNLRRLRKTLEKLQADQQAIDRDRSATKELREQLEDPKAKALSSHMDDIKAELDAIRKDDDVKYAGRKAIIEERNTVKTQLDELFQRKRESAQNYRLANDRYWTKVQENRTRRAERARAQKLAEEESKKMEIADQLREEAAVPAYQLQVEDCQTLIDYFSGKASGAIKLSTSSEPVVARNELAGVPKLELRQVEIDEGLKGLVPRKKKGEEEEAYFIGGGGKKGRKNNSSSKGTNSPAFAPAISPSASGSSTTLNVPLPTLAALLSLSIPPPSSQADVSRVIEDLRTKKAWFEANQKRATEANIARAEEEIRKLFKEGTESASESARVPAEEESDVPAPIISRESQQEPAPTPVTGTEFSVPVSAEEDEGLEEEIAHEAED